MILNSFEANMLQELMKSNKVKDELINDQKRVIQELSEQLEWFEEDQDAQSTMISKLKDKVK